MKNEYFRAHILTQNPEEAQKPFDDAFEKDAGNVTDADAIEKALHGCYGVHINLQTSIELSVAENMPRVSSRAGLRRITYISGATTLIENSVIPLANQELKVEKLINKSNISYTFLARENYCSDEQRRKFEERYSRHDLFCPKG